LLNIWIIILNINEYLYYTINLLDNAKNNLVISKLSLKEVN